MRGVGLSDRGPAPPVLELQMDVQAVMDAAGWGSAAILGGAALPSPQKKTGW